MADTQNNLEFRTQNLELNNSVILLSVDKSWQELVREHLGDVETGHKENGSPTIRSKFQVQGSKFQVQGSNLTSKFQISVSHTKGMTAVLLSDAPCGIDVERTDRDFSRAWERYLSPEEQSLSVSPLYPCAAWCAREALYKRLDDQQKGDTMTQIKIVEADIENNKIIMEHNDKLYEIDTLLHNDYLIAYTIG